MDGSFKRAVFFTVRPVEQGLCQSDGHQNGGFRRSLAGRPNRVRGSFRRKCRISRSDAARRDNEIGPPIVGGDTRDFDLGFCHDSPELSPRTERARRRIPATRVDRSRPPRDSVSYGATAKPGIPFATSGNNWLSSPGRGVECSRFLRCAGSDFARRRSAQMAVRWRADRHGAVVCCGCAPAGDL